MRRWAFFTFGVFCHLAFVALFAYMAAFVGNFLVPRTIDAPATESAGKALLIDFALLALFALQHSIMARPAFKRVWTRVVPQPIERSTYVLIAGLATIFLMWQWRGIDITIWDVRQPILRWIVWALFATGFLLVFVASLMIDHFDLFGTRQVWLYLRKRPYTSLAFRAPLLYGRVRHPRLTWSSPAPRFCQLLPENCECPRHRSDSSRRPFGVCIATAFATSAWTRFTMM